MSADEMRVLEILEALGRKLRDQILRGEPPTLEIPARTLANVIWDPKSKMLRLGSRKLRREFLDMGEAKKFMQTVLMLSLIVRARREGDYPTIRDLYYAGKHTIEYVDEHGRKRREETWDSQRESDSVIQDIEVATGLLREHMGILHDTKGKIVGRLVVRSAGDVIDCSRMGDGAYSIPPNPDSLEILDVDAEYVLVIEKDAIFNRLNKERFWEKNKCLLVTGKGQPDRSTRRMVRRLWEEFGLPVYVLTDADPYGFYIYSVYRSGSISLGYESERLATPGARFLGLTVTDIYEYKIPRNFIIKARERDLKRAKELMNYPWFRQSKEWMRQLKLFLQRQEKVEIEALSGHGFKFLTERYIPEKLSSGKWIE
ncbi:MAG: DNA topoisomerase VI [Thermoprotei archaeon]|nr:MAG: DNA topoisomerase VI [Thermoprotei archaeon]